MNKFKFTPLRFIFLVGLIHLLCASLSFTEPLSLARNSRLGGGLSWWPTEHKQVSEGTVLALDPSLPAKGKLKFFLGDYKDANAKFFKKNSRDQSL